MILCKLYVTHEKLCKSDDFINLSKIELLYFFMTNYFTAHGRPQTFFQGRATYSRGCKNIIFAYKLP